MLRADEQTLQQVRRVLAAAVAKGADVAEALDHAGLLWFEQRAVAQRGMTIGRVAQTLEDVTMAQVAYGLSERMEPSPLGVKRQIVAWLRQVAEGAQPK